METSFRRADAGDRPGMGLADPLSRNWRDGRLTSKANRPPSSPLPENPRPSVEKKPLAAGAAPVSPSSSDSGNSRAPPTLVSALPEGGLPAEIVPVHSPVREDSLGQGDRFARRPPDARSHLGRGAAICCFPARKRGRYPRRSRSDRFPIRRPSRHDGKPHLPPLPRPVELPPERSPEGGFRSMTIPRPPFGGTPASPVQVEADSGSEIDDAAAATSASPAFSPASDFHRFGIVLGRHRILRPGNRRPARHGHTDRRIGSTASCGRGKSHLSPNDGIRHPAP